MMRLFRAVVIAVFLAVGFCACTKDEDGQPAEPVANTIIVYMPWTGSINNLLSCFQTNIEDMKSAAVKDGMPADSRLLVFLSESATTSRLFELELKDGKCVEKNIRTYNSHPVTTAAGIASMLSEIYSRMPSTHYSMIIGGHGLGWIKAASFNNGETAKSMKLMSVKSEDLPMTRFFGSVSDDFQTDISTLADGIKRAGVKMRFILFDDCYMSNVETAFELKDVSDYIIGCPTEIMSYGMPYGRMIKYLLGTPDYESACSEMIDFYNDYRYKDIPYPYATIGVIDCSQLDALAADMKLINATASTEGADMTGVQIYDGYVPNVFFDLADYARHICTDSSLLDLFMKQLELTVPYKGHTDKFYTDLSSPHVIRIESYSGISVSDPSKNVYTSDKTTTSWWKATH